MELVYPELRALAARFLSEERSDHTLEPTALVHEAYMRLEVQTRASWKNDRQFLAVAATVMRRILVDHARSRESLRRGAGRIRIPADDVAVGGDDGVDILQLNEALERLEAISPRRAQVVVMRFFAGFQIAEIAAELKVSVRTVADDWVFARAWLHRELFAEPDTPTSRGNSSRGNSS